MAEEAELLSTRDICRMFKVNRVTVADWVHTGKIPAIKTLGGHARFRREEVARMLRNQHFPVPPELQSRVPRILIVDDEISILKTLPRRILARFPNVTIQTADNGVEALLHIGHALPDVLILDLLMPKMDGIEVIYRLKSVPDYSGIKILAMSGYVKDEKAVLKAGADAFFQKGTDMKELLDVLPQYLPALRHSAEATK